jgi:two-component system sensor histidine kinase PilS (NtrC family)
MEVADSLPERLDPNRILRVFAWARLVLAGLLAVLVPLMPPDFVPRVNTGILFAVFSLVAASSGALLLRGSVGRPRRAAWYVCLLDATLITAVVAATGGGRSILAFLYVLLVTGACVLLSRAGGLVIAALASTLYSSLVFVRTVVPVTHFWEPAGEGVALEVLAMFVNTGTLLVVAIVAGGLAERFLTTRRELETRQKDLSDLQVYKDLIFQSVSTGLIALDQNHVITAFNRAAEAITGRPAEQAIGRPWPAIFGDALPLADVDTAISDNLKTSIWREIELGRPGGARVPVRVTCSALVSGKGNRVGLIAACEDLSAMREMEARMRRADRLASLGRMAANIAHEIRNPLASLTGAIEVLTSNIAAEETRDRLAGIVLRESDRLNQIIRGFLEYARPAPLALDTLDVAHVLDDVLLLLEHRATSPSLKITRDFPPSIPWRIDGDQFKQALWNLCLNAAEAMPEGGELSVGAVVQGNRLEVSVTDTGEGIAPADLQHVFEPFFSTKPEGTGLGLALVHRIVRDHGGDIGVRSSPGLGTTFTITLLAGGA